MKLMKSKIIQLFFLVVAGLIIGWREWSSTKTTTLKEDILFNSEYRGSFSGFCARNFHFFNSLVLL